MDSSIHTLTIILFNCHCSVTRYLVKLELMEENSSSRTSNCNAGCRIPFFSYVQEFVLGTQLTAGPEAENAALLDSVVILGFEDEDEYKFGILPKVELLLDKFGIECVVFYPTEDAMPTGKKAILRSRLGEGRVEIRLR